MSGGKFLAAQRGAFECEHVFSRAARRLSNQADARLTPPLTIERAALQPSEVTQANGRRSGPGFFDMSRFAAPVTRPEELQQQPRLTT